jgi:hypothetical protein
MGDNGADKNQATDVKSPEIYLHITLNEAGAINVNGILRNEPLALWLLDKAKDIIKAVNIQVAQDARKIIPAKHGILDFMRRK